jgi:hypothetical protein
MIRKVKSFFFGEYFFSQERKRLEDALVDDILRISSVVRSNDLKLILHKLQSSNNKIVSKEFSWALNKINKGHRPKEVFKVIKEKYNSVLLSKFLDLLEYSTSSGTVTLNDYKNIIKDFLKSRELLDERKSVLLMQKYTIIFAGGLIVPGILGVVISLVKSLVGIVDVSVIGLSSSSTLYLVSYYCSIIYIIEYIIISSIYLSQLDDNSKKIWVYICFLLPVSLLIFFISSYIV